MSVTSVLFSPFRVGSLELANRIVLSPMCMYSAGEDGAATDWHLVHLGARALGGAGLLLTEAVSVEPRGRISVHDLGLWSDEQIEPLSRIARFCRGEGVPIGVQLAHAGRKAYSAERGIGPDPAIGPTDEPFAEGWIPPRAMAPETIDRVVAAWGAAARRARDAGVDVIEIHHAHGYLLHQFLSPLTNRREDAYGGGLKERARFTLRVIDAVRAEWPIPRPLFLRISASDWVDSGLTPDDWIELAPRLARSGIDLLDCSSGGAVPAPPPAGLLTPGYQVPFARRIRADGRIPTMAVGLVTDPVHAEEIVREGSADLVALGRELLRDPHWPLRAARVLGVDRAWPRPYQRGKL